MLYLSIEPGPLSYKLRRIRRKNSAADIIVFFCAHISVPIAISQLESHFFYGSAIMFSRLSFEFVLYVQIVTVM